LIEFKHPQIVTKEEEVIFDIKLSELEPIEALGGDITQTNIDGDTYKIHAFKDTTDEIFDVLNKGSLGKIDILIVGGGGGSGSGLNADRGAGGGGGVIFKQNYNIEEKKYDIFVGDGGIPDNNGGNTIFDKDNINQIISLGGGAGGNFGENGSDGASGGGGGGTSPNKTSGGSSINNQGYMGGAGGGTSESGRNAGGGGGGAGSKGLDSPNNTRHGGDGGVGLYYGDIFSDNFGDDGYFGGGGGGSGRDGGGEGGKGGGGNGASSDGDTNSYLNGAKNTGGGAGASESEGGSGIILIRYRI